jgi:hypothetical protein
LVLSREQAIFEKPERTGNRHLKPLYVKGFVNGKSISKMLVDGGAAVNLMPYATFKKLGKNSDDLIKTNMVLKDSGGNPSEAKGVLNVELTIGSKTVLTTFFVIDGKGSYSLLDSCKLLCSFNHAPELDPMARRQDRNCASQQVSECC